MVVNSRRRKIIARRTKPAHKTPIPGLLHHLRNGDKAGEVFTPEIWAQVTARLNELFLGTDIPLLAVDQVKNGYASVCFLPAFSG